MSTLSLRLPESVHRQLAELARREGVSMNQLINSAISEKLAALMTEVYLEERAARAKPEKYDAVLAKVADIEPDDVDRLDADEAG
jgi:post-segregation antitoxin (ccd killing protein)